MKKVSEKEYMKFLRQIDKVIKSKPEMLYFTIIENITNILDKELETYKGIKL